MPRSGTPRKCRQKLPFKEDMAHMNQESLDIIHKLEEDLDRTLHTVFDQSYIKEQFYRTPQEQQQRVDIRDQRIYWEIRNRYHPIYYQSKGDGNISFEKKRDLTSLLARREQLGTLSSRWLLSVRDMFLPITHPKKFTLLANVNHRLYCGEFNAQGDKLLIGGQSPELTIYDTKCWEPVEDVAAKGIRWTVTDAHFLQGDQYMVYSTISKDVHFVFLKNSPSSYDNALNPHHQETLDFAEGSNVENFGIWSICANRSGEEIIAGTSNNCVILYNVNRKEPVCHVRAHSDDVNAVAFVDGDLSSNVFVSGSDDSTIKLWDRRLLSISGSCEAQGCFLGHTEGLTHLSSKGDGFYFISNSKDQTCKLWDIRRMNTSTECSQTHQSAPKYYWDYRFEHYPGQGKPVTLPNDNSVMTYRGHWVLETLIRAHFSPMETTGQRYIITGSADGRVYVFDVLTGNVVDVLFTAYKGVTRDVCWHPYEPVIVSPDFYGKLYLWERDEL